MKWTTRPTALHAVTKYCDFSAGELYNLYEEDCWAAARQTEKIEILPRSPQAKLRTLQWNLHYFGNDSPPLAKGIIDTIREANADVIVLNEYAFFNTTQGKCQLKCEKELAKLGYVWRCGKVIFPTFVAIRNHYIFESEEVLLCGNRSAVVQLIGRSSASPPSERVWVVGTHLDDLDGSLRQEQMRMLQEFLNTKTKNTDKVILMGDLNEQRPQDYNLDEWKFILESKEKRGIDPALDQLSSILQTQGYLCAWNFPQLLVSAANRNWETSHPPATHWTGSIIDYSYGKLIEAIRVSISPVGWSDHRMTVCDWTYWP
mmetsp:Transcript_36478/g.88401  ORF Transcript_36478/g.88401 Transcript_36478/m.88401 type:complete len:316 (+) Transcript_36478:62-1009(+)